MRILSLAILAAASTLSIAGSVAPASAGAQDTYCLQGRSYGYPGNCQFSSYEQCLATASGTDSGCGINPRRAYGPQQRRGYSSRY